MVVSPIGRIWLHGDQERINALRFTGPDRSGSGSPLLHEAARQLDAYFSGRLKKFDLPLTLNGTDLQLNVWSMLTEIPIGSTSTYGKIAEGFGGNSFARAIGAACGSNPIPIIVPCHRVIASNGKLTGYIGGLDRKRWLLQHEGAIQRPTAQLFPIGEDTFAA